MKEKKPTSKRRTKKRATETQAQVEAIDTLQPTPAPQVVILPATKVSGRKLPANWHELLRSDPLYLYKFAEGKA